MSARDIEISGIPVFAMRVNYVGELGWELHASVDRIVELYDALCAAGADDDIRDFGVYAVDSLRLEKCCRAWKQDLLAEASPLNTSLDRFIKLDKDDFIGRGALRLENEQGPAQRFVPLLIDGDVSDAPFGAPVRRASKCIGFATSSGFGHRIGRTIALAYLDAALCEEGADVEIEILGKWWPAVVTAEPLYDANNERPRS